MLWSVVIKHDTLNPAYLLPKRIKKDTDGEPIRSSRGVGEYVEEICSIAGKWHCPLLAWRSTAEQLRDPALQGPPKRICNMVKKFINHTDCAMWYHNADGDGTAQFGGRHLHVVCRTDEKICGGDKQLHNDCNYRSLKQLIESHGGYCRSQGVRNVYALMRHFCEPPRIYMGSRSHDLGLVLQLHLDPSSERHSSHEPHFQVAEYNNRNDEPGTISDWDFDIRCKLIIGAQAIRTLMHSSQ